MNIINEVKHYNKFCEVFGRTLNTGISIINSGYSGEIVYNACQRQYKDMWKYIQDDAARLVKEIAFIKRIVQGKEDEVERQAIINRKLTEKKAIQRAAAQYMNTFGYYENDREVAKRLNSLRDITYSVKWSFEDPMEFMRQHDSKDTLFLLRPGVHDDIISDTFVECMNTLEGSWVMCDFLDDTVLEIYKDFDIKYDYDCHVMPKLKASVMKGI